MREQVLVVRVDYGRRHELVELLTSAGYDARGASTFREAKQMLGSCVPELLIADERLGDFNGLHVAMFARARAPQMKAIVVSRTKDPCLESEARRLHVPCLVEPAGPTEWLKSISKSLHSEQEDVVVH